MESSRERFNQGNPEGKKDMKAGPERSPPRAPSEVSKGILILPGTY